MLCWSEGGILENEPMLTWVDLMIYTFFKVLMEHGKSTDLDEYPLTKQLCRKIAEICEGASRCQQEDENSM
ncbi:unnamed protein product [Gongylonema pulchrum]|uniref:Uncharacterized protein n=1 Tax=Gongylonema pulchrum TaxID=637853 RepID=A0A183CZT8_9BILA|nr:unnamed protein product [Gongylonema pulchrum]